MANRSGVITSTPTASRASTASAGSKSSETTLWICPKEAILTSLTWPHFGAVCHQDHLARRAHHGLFNFNLAHVHVVTPMWGQKPELVKKHLSTDRTLSAWVDHRPDCTHFLVLQRPAQNDRIDLRGFGQFGQEWMLLVITVSPLRPARLRASCWVVVPASRMICSPSPTS